MFVSMSMMCANYACLGEEVQALEKAGADRFHLDLMDGYFVPNYALGLCDIKCICKMANVPSEIHMMVNEPERYISMMAETGAQLVYFHPEACHNPTGVVQTILMKGMIPGIALSPGTSVETVIELLHIVKHIIVMCVTPGFVGGEYLPYIENKLERLLEMKEKWNLELLLDGASSLKRIEEWGNKGVDGFVLGSASKVFESDYATALKHIRNLVKRG